MELKGTAWQNSRWKLDIYNLQKPDGTKVEAGVVRHPGAVILVPIDANGEVLMLKQYRLPFDRLENCNDFFGDSPEHVDLQ